jgi:hypothetical protein
MTMPPAMPGAWPLVGLTLSAADIHKPEPVGDPSAIKQLGAVVFVGIEAALKVTPRGLGRVRAIRMLGGFGTVLAAVLPLLTIHATDPLPQIPIYLVLTPEELRLYAAEKLPYEIGRWRKRTYHATVSADGGTLDLKLERLGVVHLDAERRSVHTRNVFDLVVGSAAGPVPPT